MIEAQSGGGTMAEVLSALIIVGAILGVLGLLYLAAGVRFIPNNRIGLVEKRFSARGSVKTGLIALNGEAGYQPQVLRGGLYYLWAVQYLVHPMPLVTIAQGKIGYIFARDGKQLEPAQVLASNVTANDFQWWQLTSRTSPRPVP
jgi:uncharacterized membrane protein YqiK